MDINSSELLRRADDEQMKNMAEKFDKLAKEVSVTNETLVQLQAENRKDHAAFDKHFKELNGGLKEAQERINEIDLYHARKEGREEERQLSQSKTYKTWKALTPLINNILKILAALLVLAVFGPDIAKKLFM